ncbi:hypothetical protein B9Z55_015316 [Caenorhabditis nigoni]|uniref:SUN domain-containing protein n=1 Tax=Caenorhabditis nigoni TaxID=1611254 RepID=A0A2G5U9P8_9PELO|nr:hypothetical protein B9Z55_015316 [Caenorhabditis nigoni]
MCNISSHFFSEVSLIGKVQFRFRENYGHPEWTCVNLVRVYGETESPVKMEKHLDSEKTCADLKWYYDNSYLKYIWIETVQYSMKMNAAPSAPSVVKNV